MSQFAIEISNLNKIYAQKNSQNSNFIHKKALDNINLQIKKGSFFALLGPNGAGKSTLINILAGIVNKSSGLVKIANIDIDKAMQQAKFKIGIVPQELIIDPFFNVFETLEFYAGYYGVKKKERRTIEIIEALGLKDKTYSTPRSLSGGMRRRLLVAKALVHNPEILVLDEPTAGVDVELRNQLWNYVSKLNKQYSTTIVLTTHYLEEAEKLCDEIAIINKGKLIIQQPKHQLMNILNSKKLIITSNKIEKTAHQINNFITANLNLQTENVANKIIVEIVQDKIEISYDPQIISVEIILKSLSENNISITDILTKQPDLEEIFKHLIKT